MAENYLVCRYAKPRPFCRISTHNLRVCARSGGTYTKVPARVMVSHMASRPRVMVAHNALDGLEKPQYAGRYHIEHTPR